jgi:hypothetical protein
MLSRSKKLLIIFTGLIIIFVCLYIFKNNIETFKAVETNGIIINLHHGLGNQLFSYAAGLSLKRKYNVPLYLLPTVKKGNTANVHSDRDYRDIFSEGIPIEYEDKIVKNAHKFKFTNKNIYGYHDEDEIPIGKYEYIYLHDYQYQHFDNVKNVISELRSTIVPKLKETYGNIVQDPESSAFLHVRRGDFLTEDGGDRVIPEKYFDDGLNILNNKKQITTLYITSDDIDWCKNRNWNTEKKIIFFDDPDELKTLYLMSSCKGGAVIPNSSFSCWGAFLGAHESNGTIIYPWFPKSFLNSLPDSWTSIDI